MTGPNPDEILYELRDLVMSVDRLTVGTERLTSASEVLNAEVQMTNGLLDSIDTSLSRVLVTTELILELQSSMLGILRRPQATASLEFLERADSAMNRGLWDHAAADYRRSLEANWDQPNAHVGLALALLADPNRRSISQIEALHNLSSAIRVGHQTEPTVAVRAALLAAALLDEQHRSKDATALLADAYGMQPLNYSADLALVLGYRLQDPAMMAWAAELDPSVLHDQRVIESGWAADSLAPHRRSLLNAAQKAQGKVGQGLALMGQNRDKTVAAESDRSPYVVIANADRDATQALEALSSASPAELAAQQKLAAASADQVTAKELANAAQKRVPEPLTARDMALGVGVVLVALAVVLVVGGIIITYIDKPVSGATPTHLPLFLVVVLVAVLAAITFMLVRRSNLRQAAKSSARRLEVATDTADAARSELETARRKRLLVAEEVRAELESIRMAAGRKDYAVR